MAAIRRIQVVWEGLPGSPYLSTFHFSSASAGGVALAAAVNTFLGAIKSMVMPPLIPQVQADQLIIDEETGGLLDVESIPPAAGPSSTGSGEVLPYATQGVLKLGTDTVVAGRRLQGRLFIPAPSEMQSTGVPLAAYQTAITNAGNGLITSSAAAGPWCVWSRPVKAGGEVPPRAGTSGVVTSAVAWGKWGVQRRRRD